MNEAVFSNPTPSGRSRESTLRLCADGHFEHEGQRVAHQGMQRAFATWVYVHPTDGRFVLANAEDWSYLQVDDTPLFVTRLWIEHAALWASLSNTTSMQISRIYQRLDGALLLQTRLGHAYVWAKLDRHATFQLGELATDVSNKVAHFPNFTVLLVDFPKM